MKKPDPNAGFTLVEIVTAVAINATLIGIAVTSFLHSTSVSSTVVQQARVQQDARMVMAELVRTLRMADASTIAIDPVTGAGGVTFRVPIAEAGSQIEWSSEIEFRHLPSMVDTNRNGLVDEGSIVRIQDGITRVLCHGVRPDGFTLQLSENNLLIRLQIFGTNESGQETASACETSVSLRNRSL